MLGEEVGQLVHADPLLSLRASNLPCAEDGGRIVHCSHSAMLGGSTVTSSFPRADGCILKGVIIQNGLFSVCFTVSVCLR